MIQLQHDNKQYVSQLERYQLNLDKLQTEINEKQNVRKEASLPFLMFVVLKFSLLNKYKMI